MSNLEFFLAITLSNAIAVFFMWRQRKKHVEYKERVHALLADEGFAEGEPGAIIDEALRVTANLGMPEPNARDFAHALIRQDCFRRAVAHETLHRIYVETYGELHE